MVFFKSIPNNVLSLLIFLTLVTSSSFSTEMSRVVKTTSLTSKIGVNVVFKKLGILKPDLISVLINPVQSPVKCMTCSSRPIKINKFGFSLRSSVVNWTDAPPLSLE